MASSFENLVFFSFGILLNNSLKALTGSVSLAHDITLGYHAHNNLQQAFGNAEALVALLKISPVQEPEYHDSQALKLIHSKFPYHQYNFPLNRIIFLAVICVDMQEYRAKHLPNALLLQI